MTVTVKPNFGKTTFSMKPLRKKGDITICIEFTGTVTEKVSQHHKSVMIQKRSIKLLEMGSATRRLALLKPHIKTPTLSQCLGRLPRSMCQDHFRFEKGGRGSSGRLCRFADRRRKQGPAEVMVFIYKSPPSALRYQAIQFGDIR